MKIRGQRKKLGWETLVGICEFHLIYFKILLYFSETSANSQCDITGSNRNVPSSHCVMAAFTSVQIHLRTSRETDFFVHLSQGLYWGSPFLSPYFLLMSLLVFKPQWITLSFTSSFISHLRYEKDQPLALRDVSLVPISVGCSVHQ